jgi:peptide-methionine (R)-S-oxide reductase
MPAIPRDQLPQSDDEWRARLTPEQFAITRKAGTERAFTGEYWDCHEDGTYLCVCCDAPLFSSGAKYESGSGWPSFFEALTTDAVEEAHDASHGMVGHVFPDGPRPTGLRYCMNSASLKLDKDQPSKEQ